MKKSSTPSTIIREASVGGSMYLNVILLFTYINFQILLGYNSPSKSDFA